MRFEHVCFSICFSYVHKHTRPHACSMCIWQVGHGDVVTVRVPTHEGGSCLYWEFATDSYDIGFGVYFEWGKSQTNEVQVQVCDSEDEDDLDGGDEEDDGKRAFRHLCASSITNQTF